jgi:hypothetical protein
MVVDERARHQLFQKLEETLGPEPAACILMEHLPPVGWADVATKRDLDALETKLDARFEARLERAMRQQLQRFIAWQFALAGVVIAAVRF